MPLPDDVGLELGRLVDRWRVLPVDRASVVLPAVHDLLADLEAATARCQGRAAVPVPDLGPGPVLEQVTVLLHDYYAAAAQPPAEPGHWAGRLAAVRDATW